MKDILKLMIIRSFFLTAAFISACGHTVTEKDKISAQAHFDLGTNYLNLAQPQNALEEYLKALNLNPEMAELHNGLGLLYQMAFRKYIEAEEHYLKAIELNPKYPEAINNLGTLYIDLEQYEKAAEMFEKVLSDILYRTPYMAEGNLGWALHKMGKTEDGVSHLKKSISMNPRYCLSYRMIGMIGMDKDDYSMAKKYFKGFSENCPDVSEAFYKLGMAAMKADDRETAVSAFTECVKKGKDDSFGQECEKSLKLLQ